MGKGGSKFAKDGLSVISSISISNEVNHELELFQNIPNPAIDNTSIGFLSSSGWKREINVIKYIGSRYNDPNQHSLYQRNALDSIERKESMSAGVYLYKLEANNKLISKQLTL